MEQIGPKNRVSGRELHGLNKNTVEPERSGILAKRELSGKRGLQKERER